jgi:hypothetical protein
MAKQFVNVARLALHAFASFSYYRVGHLSQKVQRNVRETTHARRTIDSRGNCNWSTKQFEELAMSRQAGAATSSHLVAPSVGAEPSVDRLRSALGMVSAQDMARLPFVGADATGGAEAELQASVQGSRATVDLPLAVSGSDFLANILRRAAVGDTAPRQVHALERFLDANSDQVWDNSWVRFPRRLLGPSAADVFLGDLRADKADGSNRMRGDAEKFLAIERGIEYARIPISYLLKLALADAVAALPERPEAVRKTGRRLLANFLSDNTSPETCSFNVVNLSPETGGGRALAREAGRRFLLTQLLLAYANRRYELEATGQKAAACHAPTPPVRQRELNELISDSFYRELFMNPCLSGWDRGEDKSAYMGLCHEVVSRSQLNGVKKLRDAGIITNNLVVMPNTSNLSLANNGVHVSIGSKRLTGLVAAGDSGFGVRDEKYFGDLAIKIMEHFLPLFVGTYSAAPYRLGFQDFHPEIALGFLPHELDFTHLRMLWRRWKGKANVRALGITFTPCGPSWIDRALSSAFGLRGDWVPDFRLIDYLVFLLSTNTSPSLSGVLGNSDRLKRDLASLGVFDARMSLYLLVKLREQAVMGFSGFEARQYSLFERFGEDMGRCCWVAEPSVRLRLPLHRRWPLHPCPDPRRSNRGKRASASDLRLCHRSTDLLRSRGHDQPVSQGGAVAHAGNSAQPALPRLPPGGHGCVPARTCVPAAPGGTRSD